ncbi:MAG: PASTA domain-containing protein, partial [Pygmaiobacter sp.]
YDANDTTMQITAYLSDQVGKLLVEAQSNLQKQGFFQNVVGEGTTVVRQYPPAGTTLAKGSTITLYTGDAADNVVTVPDILGRSAKSVSQAFTAAGLNLYKDGALSDDAAVKALAQNVPAGTQVPEGSIITVTFGDNTLYD